MGTVGSFKPMLCVDTGVQLPRLLGNATVHLVVQPSGPDGPGLGLALTQLGEFRIYLCQGSRIRQLLMMTLNRGQVHPGDLKEQKSQADS